MLRRRIARAAALIGSWSVGAAPAGAGEAYYVLIFGAQSSALDIKSKHTWATFVRAVGDGADPAGYQVFAHTISLVPATREVRTFALDPEPASNLDLAGSLLYARSKGAETTAWGPFAIRPEAYARSLAVFRLVNSGAVRYRAIDTLSDPLVADCIHAVTAVDPDFGRGHYPLIRTGNSASRYIARQVLRRNREDHRARPDPTWIVASLGLDRAGVEVIPPSRLAARPWPLGWRGD